MTPKVSIIVPIYNMEKYLERCLDSLLAQSLKDIEIITVNDGSTDSSGSILDSYAANDSRIKVFQKNNEGVSSARNFGMKMATGDYIGFVDPDDWVNHQMYKEMYNIATNDHADIVMCTYMREFGTHSKEKIFELPVIVHFNEKDLKTKVMRQIIGPLNNELARPDFLDAWGTVWCKIYKSELLRAYNIKFENLKEIGTSEDSLFNIHAVANAKSFVFINTPFYHYWRSNNQSITTNYKPQLKEQWSNLYRKIEHIMDEHNLKGEYVIALNNRKCINVLGLGLNVISQNHEGSTTAKIREIHAFLSDPYIKTCFKHFDLTNFPLSWKFFYFLAKFRISLGFYLMLLSIEGLRKIVK